MRFFILLFASATALHAQEPSLRATAEKNALRLGEPVRITVEASQTAGIDSIGPIAADSLGRFDLLGVRTDEPNRRWTLEVMTIDTGTVSLPPVAFGYSVPGDTLLRLARTNSLMFRVAGVDVPPDADIRDIKPPQYAPWLWEDIWPYLLALALAAVAWYGWRKYRKNRPGPEVLQVPKPAVEPHVLALRQLRELEEKKLWQQGKVKEYYSECTEIIRRFFEGRWMFPALERTTDEILDELRNIPDVAEHLQEVSDLLRSADMVKFAKARPGPDEHTQALAAAYDIVRSMQPKPAAVETEERATADVR